MLLPGTGNWVPIEMWMGGKQKEILSFADNRSQKIDLLAIQVDS
jgi:hypothetical protein